MGSMFDTKRYLFKLRAYWPWWLALALVVFVAVNAAGLLLPKKYTSTARIRVNMPIATGRDSNLLDPTNELRVIKDRMSSPSYYDTAEPGDQSIIEQLGLARGMNTESVEYQQLKRGIAERMLVWQRTNNLVDMSYWDYDPKLAHGVLRKSIDKWRIETERRIVRQTTDNVTLLEAQLKQADDRLTSTSAAVLAFKVKHPDATAEAYTELRARREELIKTRTTNMQKAKGLQDSIVLAQEQLKREMQSVSPQRRMERENPQYQEATLELAKMERELSLMLQNFTEKHPKVQAQRRSIEMQKEMIGKLSKNGPTTMEPEQVANDPMWQARRDVDKLGLELRETQTMVTEADKDIAQLDETMARIPPLQGVLNELLRNEALYRNETESLKTKLVTARYLGSGTIREQYGFTIDYVEQPEVPMAPSAPRKSMIMGLSGAASVGLTAAMVWLTMIMDLAVRSAEEARSLLRMPVLGVVQPIQTGGRKRRKLAA